MTKVRCLVLVATIGFLSLVLGCSAQSSGGSKTVDLGGSGDSAGSSAAGTTQAVSGGIGGETSTGGSAVLPIGGGGGLRPDECGRTEVNIRRNPINVILVVDRSTSTIMSDFGSYDTRWDALRDALMGDNGLVLQYQALVRFGYEGYTGFPGDTTGLTCPDIDSVPYEINNYDTILPVYDASRPTDFMSGAIGQTPTGEALKIIIDVLEAQFTATPDVLAGGPFVFILATDGEPDTCADPNNDGSPEATQLVVQQVTRAKSLGVSTYVLSVGSETSDTHLQEVANAGIASNGAQFWKADDDQGLQDAIAAIIGEALSCELEIQQGEIVDPLKACEQGVVMLNNVQLPCSPVDGWQVVDSTHIELTGSACEILKSSPSVVLEASFPCGIIIG
ncbi:MAG: VWA domain-containing protein [Deltaproteobacteria bacterium]|nr:VWA domain-containing protein [Deltaproteobacteria bacterium]